MLVRPALGAFFTIAMLSVRASGQTTQPSPPAWDDTVNNIARALVEPVESAGFSSLVAEEVAIRSFDSSEANPRVDLRQKTSGLSLIGTHAYIWPATTIAGDLRTDVKNCPEVPDSIRRQFVPRDEGETRKANTIAQQWVAGILHPTNGQVFGLILLWEPPAPSALTTNLLIGSTASANTKPPIFVLIKGQAGDDGQIKILQISYGDSRQALN